MANLSKPVRPLGNNNSHSQPRPSSMTSKSKATHLNAPRNHANTLEERDRTQRPRKPTHKVEERRAQEAEAQQRREEQAARRVQRAQRNAPDTEDEDEGVDAGIDTNKDGGADFEENDDEFSSRVVHTKLSKAPAGMKAVPGPLVRTQGRVPASSVTIAAPNALENETEQGFADDHYSPRFSQTPSPTTQDAEDEQDLATSKRHRSSSVESLRDAKSQKIATGARPKASDYDDIMKECIIEAITNYRCSISAQHPFPDHATETQLSRSAWAAACKELDYDVPLNSRIAKLITTRGSHTRGELKTKARPIVEMFYQFESGHNKKIIASNRELAEALKDGMGYAYRVHHSNHSERKGLYRNTLIQKILNAMWFRNRRDEGVVYESFFRPIHEETIALILTVIECCIDEWVTGIRTDCPFTAAAYRDVYEEHLRCLKDFASHAKKAAPGLYENILEKLYNRGRFHAGAQPVSEISTRAIPISAFEAAVQEYKDDDETETDGENGDSQWRGY